MGMPVVNLKFQPAAVVSLFVLRDHLRQVYLLLITQDVATYTPISSALPPDATEGCLLMKTVFQCEKVQ